MNHSPSQIRHGKVTDFPMASAMPLPIPTVKTRVTAQIPTQTTRGPRQAARLEPAAEPVAASSVRAVEVVLTLRA
jgi:hypothetical protein